VDTDLKIAGAVTYVGHSSIDIQIEVTQVDQGIFRLFIDLEKLGLCCSNITGLKLG
jgi:hypothetical protein